VLWAHECAKGELSLIRLTESEYWRATDAIVEAQNPDEQELIPTAAGVLVQFRRFVVSPLSPYRRIAHSP
jgi:hypothetical protein